MAAATRSGAAPSPANRVRIIGGTHRSRIVTFPQRPGLRPTPDRVRETLFNWLGQDLTGVSCLDLFAGSGALGFEAASRGASSVVLVEKDPQAVAALSENARRLAFASVRIVRGHALEFLASTTECFGIVFADPPFEDAGYDAILARLVPRLTPGGRVYVEAPHALEAPPGWSLERRLKAGHVHAHLMQPNP